MTTLSSIVLLLQVAISLLGNPNYQTSVEYKTSADSFVAQAMQLANKAIAEESGSSQPVQAISQSQGVLPNNNTNINSVFSSAPVGTSSISSAKTCNVSFKDDSDGNTWTNEINWTSDGLPTSIHGIVYGSIGNNAGNPVYSKFGELSTPSSSIKKIHGSDTYKIVFDDGTTCYSK